MADLLKKLFFDDVREKNWPKTGKFSSSVLLRHRNRSGVVELIGREPLMCAKVENGVTKSCQNFRRKNRKINFWPIFSRHFFEHDRLLCARVDIGVTESPTKTAQKEEKHFFGL